jgi:LPXTG-motif cell wall-anchored protein
MHDVEDRNTGLSISYIATLAAMDGSSARRRTRATVVTALAILMLTPAPAALAQSAGDEQYADPLAGDGGGQEQQAPQSRNDGGSGDSGASAPATPTPAAPVPEAAPEAALPRTGTDARLPAGLGVALTAIGAAGLAAARRSRHARR